MYMPPLGLLCSALIIKAFALWLKMHEDPTKVEPADEGEKEAEEVEREPSLHGEKVRYIM
jgi:hypothetical protein